MKRKSTIYTFLMVVIALYGYSCSHLIDQIYESGDIQVNTYQDFVPLTKSEHIALVVQEKGTYKISKEEALISFDRFAASNSENKTSDVQVKSITLRTSPKTGKDIYFEVIFENEKGTGFALLSADERLDEVLCYTEVGSISDTSFNKSLKFCLDIIDLYAEVLTEEEIDITT